MPAYLFNSSAAVKRYAIETGSRWVFGIVRPSAANSIFVARITGAEVVAALARKRKGQHLTADDAAKAIRRFSRHFARRFQKVTITNDIVAAAMLYADSPTRRCDGPPVGTQRNVKELFSFCLRRPGLKPSRPGRGFVNRKS